MMLRNAKKGLMDISNIFNRRSLCLTEESMPFLQLFRHKQAGELLEKMICRDWSDGPRDEPKPKPSEPVSGNRPKMR